MKQIIQISLILVGIMLSQIGLTGEAVTDKNDIKSVKANVVRKNNLTKSDKNNFKKDAKLDKKQLNTYKETLKKEMEQTNHGKDMQTVKLQKEMSSRSEAISRTNKIVKDINKKSEEVANDIR